MPRSPVARFSDLAVLLERSRATPNQVTRRNETMHRQRRHRENPSDLPLKCGRRTSHHSSEARRERPQAFVADREAHLGHRQPFSGQQTLGAVDSQPRQELVRRFTEHAREHAMVMELRNAGFTSRIRQAQRLIEPVRQKIPRPAQSPEKIVIHHRSVAIRRRVNQRMLHGNILLQPALPVDLQLFSTPYHRISAQCRHPNRCSEQVSHRDGPKQAQDI